MKKDEKKRLSAVPFTVSPAADWRLMNGRGGAQTAQWLVDIQNSDGSKVTDVRLQTWLFSTAARTGIWAFLFLGVYGLSVCVCACDCDLIFLVPAI
jgi:hypothetical protein